MSQSESDEPLLSHVPAAAAPAAAASALQSSLLPGSSASAGSSIPLTETMSHYHVSSSTAATTTSSSGIGGSHEDGCSIDPEIGGRPLGLTGLQNLGNTCYMNAGIQALSNCPQLTGFMTDCSAFVRKPGLAKSFQRLITDMWSLRRAPYVVPAGIAQGVKKVCPAFKGYSQHDAQEFLRCLLDQLHEELKVPVIEDQEQEQQDKEQEQEQDQVKDKNKKSNRHRRSLRRLQPAHGHSHSHSQNHLQDNEDSDDMDLMISSDEADDYETCDSGLSWGRSTTNSKDHHHHNSHHNRAMNGGSSHHSLTHSHSHVPHHHKQQQQPVSVSPSNGSENGTLIPVVYQNGTSHNHHPVIADPVVSSSTPCSVPTQQGAIGAVPAPPGGYCDCDDAVSRTVSLEPESGIYSMQSLVTSSSSNIMNGNACSNSMTMLSRGRSYEDGIQCNGSMQSIMTQDLLSVDTTSMNGGTHASEILYPASGSTCNHHTSATTTSSPATNTSSSHNSNSKKQSSESSSNNTKYRSVISDIFDGEILSSVQCLTCDNVSTTKETFQDLSLSIPTREQLNFLRAQRMKSGAGSSNSSEFGEGTSSGRSSPAAGSITSATSSTAVQVSDAAMQSYSWIWSWIEWIFSIFWGPTVTLEDCLSAFFSADELKGDNMYSCQKCKKLRNGIKYSRVMELPDILCIHLKRFRHELMYSSKISSQVTFPLEGLDMAPYVVTEDQLHEQEHDETCPDAGMQQQQQQHHFHFQQQHQQQQSFSESEELHPRNSPNNSPITTYDLVSVICHHGTPASGHYTAYCLNSMTDTWYEFDDQYVTAVDPHQVAACEAYVLFYRKSSDEVNQQRLRIVNLIERSLPPDSMSDEYFISNQWINRFNTFADPGEISNRDFLCQHGMVQPGLMPNVRDMCSAFSFEVWQYLVNRYSGGPECNSLDVCRICLEKESALTANATTTTTTMGTSSSQGISHQVSANTTAAPSPAPPVPLSLSSLLLNNNI